MYLKHKEHILNYSLYRHQVEFIKIKNYMYKNI